MSLIKFKKGQWVRLDADQELGPALIIEDKEFASLRVKFLKSGEIRNYTKKNPPFKRIHLELGQKVRLKNQPDFISIEKLEIREEIFFIQTSEGEFPEWDIREWTTTQGLSDIVRQAKWTPPKTFELRFNAMKLLAQRESHPLRGAVGNRIEILPHQFWVLSEFLKSPVQRALLCDEVGLGKTIEAGLILSALNAQKKLKKVLVLVPQALKIQWLTELYNKFHIRFRLDHEDTIDTDDHRDFVIGGIEEISNNENDIDLLIVDESHRITRNPDHYSQLEAFVKKSQRVLFLSATPRASGDIEFKKMLELLGAGQKPSLFQSKREDLGIPVFRKLEAQFVSEKQSWIENFIGDWIQKKPIEKLFLICETQKSATEFYKNLRQKWGSHFALFHEGMDLIERDRQAAYFADPEGAPILISSEIGGEGRNFQFCKNLLLLDLPNDPLKIEQRIGRLDRLGQTQTVRVWCPVLSGESFETEEEKIFERLKDEFEVFEKPWTGSGIEDLGDKQNIKSLKNTNSLESFEKQNLFIRIPFNSKKAQSLVKDTQTLDQIPVQEFLEKIYELFGVEVEDFDSRGNIKASASSLMFVENFPGLGADGERVFTFDRVQALAREDLTLMSLDHPDFVEILEFFLNSDFGKLCVSTHTKTEKELKTWALGTLDNKGVSPSKPFLIEWPKNNLSTENAVFSKSHKEPKAQTKANLLSAAITKLEEIQKANTQYKIHGLFFSVCESS